MKLLKRPKIGHPRAGFVGDLLGSVLGFATARGDQKRARRSNEALLDEIRQLFAGITQGQQGGFVGATEGTQSPLSFDAWKKSQGGLGADRLTPGGGSVQDVLGAQTGDLRKRYQEYRDTFVASDASPGTYQEGSFAREEGAVRGLADIINQGFDRSRAALESSAASSRQDVSDLMAQAQADTTQRAINRGTYNSSYLDQARLGIAGQTARRFQDINARLGGAISGLESQRTGALAGAQESLANLFASQEQRSSGTQAQLASLLSGTTYTASPNYDFGGLSAALNGLFGQGA